MLVRERVAATLRRTTQRDGAVLKRSRRHRKLPEWFYVLGGLSLLVALCAAVECFVLEPNRTEERRERRRHERRDEEIIWGIKEEKRRQPERDLLGADPRQVESELKK